MGRLEPIIGTEIIKTDTGEIRLGHTFFEVSILHNLILYRHARYFVEIGVHEGGLSYLLIPSLENIAYIGIELFCELVRPEVKERYEKYSQVLHCGDCFDVGLFNYIKSLENKIIYCDGGNKAKELLHFKSACNSGDIIMTHDFYDGIRKVRGVPDENISKEVLVSDIQHMKDDETFRRLNENVFSETRIVGWKKL